MKQSSINSVGAVYIEQTDTNRTTNYVIPLTTDKGAIEIVLNPAWGGTWRLGSDHELASSHPSLTACQPEDTSQGLGEVALGNKYNDKQQYYLSPEVLETVTREHMNPQVLAGRIKVYVENLLKIREIEKERSSVSRGSDYFGEEHTQILSLRTSPRSNTVPHLGISFELGSKEGIKWIDIFGYPNTEENPHQLDRLAKEGRHIGALLRSFYLPSSFENKSY